MAGEMVGAEARDATRALLNLGREADLEKIPDGPTAAVSYGEPATEHRLLRESCGLVDRLWVEHLELTGEDRARFLNGMVTGDTKTLQPGDGRFVFFTNAQGRILSEARVLTLADSLLLELPAGSAGPIAEHLSHYIVADRVELAPRPDMRALSLVGPDAWTVAARLAPGAPMPETRWSSRQVERDGVELILAREERLGAAAITVHVVAAEAQAVAEGLLRPAAGAAAKPVGFAAVEALRIEAGQARFGPDFGSGSSPDSSAASGPGRFPQEVGETDALDFEKGCYLGQEVVARIHYRGKVNNRLCGLRLGPGELPPPGSPVELASNEVGRSGSAARSPSRAEGIALAILHRNAATGAVVEVAGISARVVDLPFAAV